ncbi:LacI family transcriptional regulator [Occultella glacieicola]|uniref:LacI family transcriptional regulator n=1 Tax=Occultella glacieicola TaxID=2518684 RepID=A0ABY2DWM1_9MICO|nr:substrate-binding domain-containing protein [Occultella glacieicola]TDE88030.1 LacI family transcriptional regulator [Occultella glacieicola]
MTSRVTLTDVARAAGVSISTASLAFSGAGPISAATKAKVLRAAADLGYSGPNPVARSLRRGRSGVIGVVVRKDLRQNFRDPVAIQTLDGVATTLGESDLGMLLIPTDDASGAAPDLLRHAAMDAAILLNGAAASAPSVRALRERGTPAVHVDAAVRGSVSIRVQDAAGMRAVAEHLRGLGHTAVGVVTLPWGPRAAPGPLEVSRPGRSSVPYTAARWAGLLEGGVVPVVAQAARGSWVEEGIRAGHALLDATPRPTALVAFSDLLAAGLLLAARERGLRVPQDVSVAGFDGVDLPWLGGDVLTTVAQPIREKGRMAAAAAIALAAGEPARSAVLGVDLRPGTTTGPAPS